jgi:hypothetical protein
LRKRHPARPRPVLGDPQEARRVVVAAPVHGFLLAR